jgi:D-threo-aldose 1-dehydrogenase
MVEAGLPTSLLGFGCADLFREATRSGRVRLLEEALAVGVYHFDLAPMYGLGRVEREFGKFARGKRDKVVIATKFGIVPTPAARLFAPAQGHLRGLAAAARSAHVESSSAITDPRSGLIGALLYRSDGYGGPAARASLERSLRELRTDFVDALFLHDPKPGDIRSDDVRGYLETARTAGQIRTWGVAGEADSAVGAADRLGSPVPVLQVRGDVFERSLRRVPPDRTQATILFGVIGRALPRILAHVRSDESRRRRWSEAVGADCGRADTIASLLLRDALRENASGTVLFSTSRVSRIRAAAEAASARIEGDPGLDAFRALVEEQTALRPEAHL